MMDATPLLRLYARRRLARLAAEDPAQAQQATLLDLVRRARDTVFGRDHDFGSIATVADFQARVPLRRYGDFWRAYWEPAYPVLNGITWPGRMPYFAFTSGTSSGSSKHIPVSRAMVRANRRAALDVLVHHLAHRPKSRVLGGMAFMLGGSTALTEVAPGIREGDLSGIAANEVPAWIAPWSFPPRAEALEADWERKIDRLARLAAERDIRMLSGTPSWVLPFLDRMAELTGRGPALPELFPALELYVHGGVSFRPYARRFGQLMQGGRAEPREVYPASEGFIAIADRQYGEGMRVLADNGLFLEFVPAAEVDDPTPTRHWAANVVTGLEYALVLSSCAGLWAYVLGDLVQVVDRAPLRLLVTGRLSTQLNVFGEHLSGEQLEEAVALAAERTGLAVGDFTVGARFAGESRGRHLFVVEFIRPPAASDLAAFTTQLDAALAAGSLDYRERRQGSVGLEAPALRVAPPGCFAAWMKARGRLGGQNKVPRVILDEAMLEGLLERL